MIFLSASIPDPDSEYFESADIVAIRDAVRALVTVSIPEFTLVCGGHPAITPMVKYVLEKIGEPVNDNIILYQSNYFKKKFPSENQIFENLIITKEGDNRKESLEIMRNEMLTSYQFEVGVFIGGKEGVRDEYIKFRKYQPEALALPVGSTGAEAKNIYDLDPIHDEKLLNEYAYMSLFKELILNQ